MTNSYKTVLMVGDRFAAFADGQGVFTRTQLIAAMRRPGLLVHLGAERVKIIVGQGVAPDALTDVRSALIRDGLISRVTMEEYVSRRIEAHRVHKHRWQNVLITVLAPAALDTFHAQLIVDDESADISDHVTGLHVPGMVLIEAARQAHLAVVDHLAAQGWWTEQCSAYSLQAMEMSFVRFAVPMPVSISISADPPRLERRELYTTSVCVTFMQCGELVAEARCEGMRHHARLLSRSESIDAQRQLANLLRPATADTPCDLAAGV
jgi:hypothetical protein